MKKNYFFYIALFAYTISFGQLTINEVSYYSSPKFVEINGPVNEDLTGWTLKFYKGNGGLAGTQSLTGTMPATEVYAGEGKSLLAFDTPDLRNNPTGGYVELLDPSNNTIQLFAYHGAVPRTSGGVTSSDIGTASSGQSLQLTDTGWVSATPTKGTTNLNQSTLPVIKNEIEGFTLFPNPVSNGELYMTSNNKMNKQVEIYSLLGQQVYAKSVQSNETMNVTNLNKGIYVLRIEEEGKIATRKLVIK